jgi:hypothetical protein
MDLVREKRLSVGILQLRRFGQGIANIEVDGANLIGIPRQVGGGKFAVLPLDLALQLRAQLDDLNLPVGRKMGSAPICPSVATSGKIQSCA